MESHEQTHARAAIPRVTIEALGCRRLHCQVPRAELQNSRVKVDGTTSSQKGMTQTNVPSTFTQAGTIMFCLFDNRSRLQSRKGFSDHVPRRRHIQRDVQLISGLTFTVSSFNVA